MKNFLTSCGFFLTAFWIAAKTVAAPVTFVPSYLVSDFRPSTSTAITASGNWSYGKADGMPMLVRYDGAGAVDIARYPVAGYIEASTMKAYGVADGGVITTDMEEESILSDGTEICILRSFDAQGGQRWSSDITRYGFGGYASCSAVSVDATGAAWVYSSTNVSVSIFAVDGSVTSLHAPIDNAARMLADFSANAAYLAGTSPPDGSPTQVSIVKMTPAGVAWNATYAMNDPGAGVLDIAESSDNSLWAFVGDGAKIFVMHVSPTGSIAWFGPFDAAYAPDSGIATANADGGATLLYWNSATADTPAQLLRIAATGNQLWQVSTATAPDNGHAASYALCSAENGDTAVAFSYYGTVSLNYLVHARFDSTGNRLFATAPQEFTAGALPEIRCLADTSSLATSGFFDHRSRLGVAIAAPQSAGITTQTNNDQSTAIATDGTAYFVASNDDRKSFALIARAADDSALWQTEVSSTWDHEGLQTPAIVTTADNVCIAGYLDAKEVVQCFARSDGTQRFSAELPGSLVDETGGNGLAGATPDGRVVVAYIDSAAKLHHALVDTNGAILHDITPLPADETLNTYSVADDGRTWILTTRPGVVAVSPTGVILFDVPTDLPFAQIRGIPGGGAIASTVGDSLTFERLDATTGARVWGNTIQGSVNRVARGTRFSSDAMYTVLEADIPPEAFIPHPALPMKIALADGTSLWGSGLVYSYGFRPVTALDADGNFVLLSSLGNGAVLTRLAAADGATQQNITLPCGAQWCLTYALASQPDGSVRAIYDTSDPITGSSWEIARYGSDPDELFHDGFE